MRFDWSASVFYNAMKHENDMSNMIGCLQVVRIYALRISFFSLLRRKIFLLKK